MISSEAYEYLGPMNQALSSYDISTQIKPALSKVWTWISKNEPGWGWEKNLLVQVFRQICIDNVKNARKQVNAGLRSQGQAVRRARPPKRQSTTNTKNKASRTLRQQKQNTTVPKISSQTTLVPTINTDDNDEFSFPSLTSDNFGHSYDSQLDSQSSYLDSQSSYTICSLKSPQSTNINNNLNVDEDEDPDDSRGEESQNPNHFRHQQGQLTQITGLFTEDTTANSLSIEDPTIKKHYRRTGAPSFLSTVCNIFIDIYSC